MSGWNSWEGMSNNAVWCYETGKKPLPNCGKVQTLAKRNEADGGKNHEETRRNHKKEGC